MSQGCLRALLLTTFGYCWLHLATIGYFWLVSLAKLKCPKNLNDEKTSFIKKKEEKKRSALIALSLFVMYISILFHIH